MRGRVLQLHLKPREGRARGLPKRAVPHLVITPEGVEGDFNRWRTETANGLYSLPYVGPERGPAFLRTLHGRRGWFARVVQGGAVYPGTPVEVTHPGLPAGRL